VPYPILLVRYEALWDHLEEIHDFVGLSRTEAASFPAYKKTYVERRPQYDQPLSRLRMKYARLIADMARLPPISLLSATPAVGWQKLRYSYQRLMGSYRKSFV
jgi:hypothetical protein